MKKVFNVVVVILAISTIFMGCISTKNVPSKQYMEDPYISYMVDYPGKALGKEVPAWITAIEATDEEAMQKEFGEKLEQEDKYYIVSTYEQNTKDLDAKVLRLAEAHCQTDFARQINEILVNNIARTSASSINDEEMEVLISQAGQVKITGFERVRNGYILFNTIDKATGKENKIYKIYQVYACNNDTWDAIQKNYLDSLKLNNSLSPSLQKAVDRADEMLTQGEGIKSGL